MELIIKELDPTICLNMIVKNESHIIEDTLKMLCSKINFSYWVICDTGSTDNTCEIITHFFQSQNIPGELHNHEWKNFAHNRTLALQAAFDKTDLAFVFDADDEICGQLNMPTTVDSDGYMLNFGHATGISYQRVLLVNNRIKWEYQSVIHEYIHCLKPNPTLTTIEGDYYIVSGRRGNRSSDVNKYLKDAVILEEAYKEAKQNGDDLHMRYAFYCANSYKDCGKHEDAIKWYKLTLTLGNWTQEKYMCCLNLYNEYNAIGETEKGIFYLVESFKYDTERMECVYILIKHYLLNGLPHVAYKYYENVKDFYEGKYLTTNNNGKLFVEPTKANFFLPYYMILVCDKVKDRVPSSYQTISKMFEIIFTKKCISVDNFYIGNILYNLQFFIEKSVSFCSNFTELFQSYIDYLETNNIELSKYDFFNKFEPYGISRKAITTIKSVFSEDDCKKSNKILIYAGFSNVPWNYTYSLHNSLGGSESAVINLANSLPKSYDIYIGGAVAEETVDNITYVNLNNLKNLVKTVPFHTVIVSRYVAFYEMFSEVSFFQSYIWGHDINLFNYGCNLDVSSILKKWEHKITGCVCQTEWHKNLFESQYTELKGKIATINNGIQTDKFVSKPMKIANRFVYTSCSERGLDRLLELWPQIVESLPDAELFIASYNKFPHNDYENKLNDVIQKLDSVTHIGSLNKDKLYELMSSAEFWLYPTNFNETSCITAMEMLMSEVICVYYPLAGLINTLGDYGIPVERGNEIDTILNLSLKQKCEIRKRGLTYALSCSWNNRADEWNKLIDMNVTANDNVSENFIIKIINLEKRTDRKEAMISNLTTENVTNYQFFKAVNRHELAQTPVLYELFKNNDFGYKKGIIGCTLSHLQLWNELLHDDAHQFYVILEDDVDLCKNFKNNLNYVSSMFVSQNMEHLALGEYTSNKNYPSNTSNILSYSKNLYEEGHITFGYLISKKAVVKMFEYINTCSIKCAIDNPQAFGYILDYKTLSHKLVECKVDNQYGSDIQQSNDVFHFNNVTNSKNSLTIAYCDWWASEYCGGIFDVNDNYITNLLKKYNGCNLDIKVVKPNETPDILFYSIFGSNHKSLKANRKVFFSGEPYGQDLNADFNITFDSNNLNNTRLPLWVCYFDDNIYKESIRRLNKEITIPVKERFCSFIASGPGLSNNRKEFVDKLSTYKTVDCGGAYLNNLGGTVPIGLNCSGKVEHNKKYKFAIAFESKYYPGYVTEKICDIFKSNTVPIYWGTLEVVKDFNPKTFINANDFSNFDELVEYIKKVDADDNLYNSYFKEPILSNMWMDIYTDRNSVFFKNLVDKIIGRSQNLLDHYFNPPTNNIAFYSGNKQDEFLSTYIFKGYKNGYFMDVGANDGITINNTLHFEKFYNWSGTNIEPLDKPYGKLVLNRPNCNNIQIAIYNKDGMSDFIHNDGHTEMISGLVDTYGVEHKQRLSNELGRFGGNSVIKQTNTKTVQTICHENNISHINYLSIDVEGAELAVLESIDYEATFIDVISFEEHYEDTNIVIIKFLENKGFLHVGKFGDIILINKKSMFIKNLIVEEIDKFSCYGSTHNSNLKYILANLNNIHSHNYKFEYGSELIKTDITDIVMTLGNANGFIEIPVSDEARAKIFGDPCWGVVKNIYITEFATMKIEIVPPHQCKFINFKHKFIMGFYDNSLCERGTTTALYSYADYAEKYFQCKSIIFYNKNRHDNDTNVVNKFNNRFLVYGVENFDQIDNIIVTNKIKYFYNTCGGKPTSTTLVKNCKNLIHAVFNIEPFGDVYSAISDYLVSKSDHTWIKAIPYMIDLPKHNENMRIELNIPSNCVVIGRYGGFNQFDVIMAHNAIKTALQTNNDLFFLFVNTAVFYEHPRIMYLNKIIDPELKVKFINTCDCMIHARSDGETFGLAIGEFSSLNKPIITCRSLVDNCHIDILGENGIIYNSEEDLVTILNDIRTIKNSKQDWNMYKEYNPLNVMQKFHDVFLPDEEFVTNNNVLNYNNISYFDMNDNNVMYKNDNANLVIVTAFLDINRDNWNKYNRSSKHYIESFYNYFNYDNNMVAFIDETYINEVLNKYATAKYKKTKFIPINKKWMEDNIYAWKQLSRAEEIMKSQKYIELVKLRINNGNPENIYAEYNAINHSKIDFIQYAINLNYASVNDIICWSDFGYFNSVFHNNCNEYPIFSLDKHKISPTHLSFFLRNKLDKDDENIMHTLLKAPEKITGSFFAGPGNLMLELQTLVHSSLNELYKNNISDDDQHIYLRCYLKNPDIFHLYINENEWPKALIYLESHPNRFELVTKILSNINNGNLVEIGCDTGQFSDFILDNNKSSTLYSIDPFIRYDDYIDSINNITGDELYNKTKTFLEQKHGNRINIVRKFSNKAINDIPNDLDFVYIDGNHKYKYVYEDICLFWEKLGPYGIIVGDDAVDTDETKRNSDGDIFIEWLPGSYGDYGVIKAFKDFINIHKCYGTKIGNQYIICKNRNVINL